MKSSLAEDWGNVTLGDVLTLNYGKSLTRKVRLPGNIPVYSSAGKTGNHNEPLVEGPGVIVGRKGTIGTVYYEEGPFFCIDTAYYIETDSKYNLKYIYYLLSSLGLERLNTDTAVPGLNRNRAYSVEINLASLNEQNKIADTLSALDNKIELNNKINENLEKQAQAIFKHWFIDFEFPDENGDPYKTSGGEMIESELGMIPKGWEVNKLGDISEIDNKSIKLPNPGLYNHFSIPAFEEDKLPVLEDGLAIKSNKYQIDNNHILISRLNPRFKRLWRPVCFGENNVCSTEFIVVKSKKPKLKSFLYSIMDSGKFYDFMLQNVTGATNSHQRVSPISIILDYKLALPKSDLMKLYINIIEPIYKKIDSNIAQNQALSQLRDTLLPKLMSGEIRIPLD